MYYSTVLNLSFLLVLGGTCLRPYLQTDYMIAKTVIISPHSFYISILFVDTLLKYIKVFRLTVLPTEAYV